MANIVTKRIPGRMRRENKTSRRQLKPTGVENIQHQDGRARLKAAYENDRRAGSTNPDRVEIIEENDPRGRHFSQQVETVPNRTDYRRSGYHGSGDTTKQVAKKGMVTYTTATQGKPRSYRRRRGTRITMVVASAMRRRQEEQQAKLLDIASKAKS